MSNTHLKSEMVICVDEKLCAGCLSCMLACTLVHEGVENLSLSRIQVSHNSFKSYPKDLKVSYCHQCVKPFCVDVCPVNACYIDSTNGNVRIIDQSKCTGCQKCIEACPFHIAIWDDSNKKAIKCDLCLHAPYISEKGTHACIEVCPVKAIRLEKDNSKSR